LFATCVWGLGFSVWRLAILALAKTSLSGSLGFGVWGLGFGDFELSPALAKPLRSTKIGLGLFG